MNHRIKCQIKDLGEVITGTTPPTSQRNYYGDAYPLIKPTDMDIDGRYIKDTIEGLSEEGYEKFKSRLLPSNTPCVVTIGTIGKICLTKEPSFCNQAVNSIVVDKDNHDPLYVFYLMRLVNPRVKFLSSGTASGRENVSKSAFENLDIEVHPLPTQRKIAAVLSAYDDLIENNSRRIAILEAMAHLLYREWFVEFRYPGHESVPLVESELGPVPEGWEVVTLGEVVELAYGKGLRKKDRQEGPFPVYGSSGVVDHHKEAIVKGPGIIVGRKGNVGSVFWADTDFYPIDTTYYVQTELPLHYVYYNLQHQNFINTHAAVPGLSRENAYRNEFIVPLSELMTNFQRFIEPVFTQVRNLNTKNTTLRQTRDLLLPRLISGELDVADLDIADENVIARP